MSYLLAHGSTSSPLFDDDNVSLREVDKQRNKVDKVRVVKHPKKCKKYTLYPPKSILIPVLNYQKGWNRPPSHAQAFKEKYTA